ncbi:ribonuclease HII [Patescibacteria group bacterium]
MKNSDIKYKIGIDEAGRGPVAGPVSVGVVCISEEFAPSALEIFGTVKDSKKLTEKKREEWYAKMLEEKKNGNIDFVVAFATHNDIDTIGIVPSIRRALTGAINKLCKDINCADVKVLLDGGLHAPKEYINQETIIKGDEKEMIISMASVAAKVVRDREMVKLAEKYPEYGLEKHKGYGTKAHYEKIRENGISPIHRVSFLTRL